MHQFMKSLTQIATFTLLLSILSVYAVAQPSPEAREKIKAHKIAFLTQRLDLTPEEAQQFWPVYNEFDKKMEALREANKDLVHGARDEELSEAEAEKRVDAFINFRKQETDLMVEYHEKFKQVLPASKVAKLYRSEEMFKRKLLEQLGKHRGQGGPGQGRGGRGEGPRGPGPR